MKRKVLSVLLTFLLMSTCMFLLTACGHEHTYETEVISPTCTEQGYTIYTCECGDSYNGDYVDKLGHNFVDYTYNNDATCLEDGTETAICENGCGEDDTRTKLDTALGHGFVEYISNNDGTKTATCICNEKDTIIDTSILIVVNNVVTGITEHGKTLSKLVILDGVVGVDEWVFDKCSFTSVILPDSLISLGPNAFYDCKNLESVVIGNEIASISEGAFEGCSNLTSIVIGSNVTSIARVAFYNCSSLEKIYYVGTAESWANINVNTQGNEHLENVTIYYYVENEANVPDNDGNYWHYDANGNAVAW